MDLRRKMGEMGYFGIRMPEEYGGLGLGVFEYCLIAEELARGWMSVASIIARAGAPHGRHRLDPEERRLELTKKSGARRIPGRRRRCPSRTPARISPPSVAAPCSTATNG